MALINCPECGRRVSDKAAACPGCGYPIAGTEWEDGGWEREDDEEDTLTPDQIRNESFVAALPAAIPLGHRTGERLEGHVSIWDGNGWESSSRISIMEGGIELDDRRVAFRQMTKVRLLPNEKTNVEVIPARASGIGVNLGGLMLMSGGSSGKQVKETLASRYTLKIEYVDIDTRKTISITMDTMEDPADFVQSIDKGVEYGWQLASCGNHIINIATGPTGETRIPELDGDRMAQAIEIAGWGPVVAKVKEIGYDYGRLAEKIVNETIKERGIRLDGNTEERMKFYDMEDQEEAEERRSMRIKIAVAAALAVAVTIMAIVL